MSVIEGTARELVVAACRSENRLTSNRSPGDEASELAEGLRTTVDGAGDASECWSGETMLSGIEPDASRFPLATTNSSSDMGCETLLARCDVISLRVRVIRRVARADSRSSLPTVKKDFQPGCARICASDEASVNHRESAVRSEPVLGVWPGEPGGVVVRRGLSVRVSAASRTVRFLGSTGSGSSGGSVGTWPGRSDRIYAVGSARRDQRGTYLAVEVDHLHA